MIVSEVAVDSFSEDAGSRTTVADEGDRRTDPSTPDNDVDITDGDEDIDRIDPPATAPGSVAASLVPLSKVSVRVWVSPLQLFTTDCGDCC